IHRGRRLSAARAYLHPVMDRPNLTVKTNAFVRRIVFEGTRATGVSFDLLRGPTRRAHGKEIILCGGAINSPQVLQLSGVGNAADLEKVGIKVVHTCPASARTCRTT